MTVLAVALGGAVGALLRWALSRLNGPPPAWPWGTFTANMLGCLALGLVVAVAPGAVITPRPLEAGLVAGVLGGLTTFSTFAVESVVPSRPRWGYIAATVAGGSGLAWIGVAMSPPP